jgi:hypothetical protein
MFIIQEFVYFITDGDAIKIGWSTRDVCERIIELQTGNPRPLSLLGVIPCALGTAFNLEQHLHKKFANFQKIGGGSEWFENVNDIHLEYRRALHDQSLFDSFDVYMKNVKKLSSGSSKDRYVFDWVRAKVIPLLHKPIPLTIFAPPKSGKRKMVQSCALLYPHAKHIILTAQNKTDMRFQEKEHSDSGITYISATNTSKEIESIMTTLKAEILSGKCTCIIIHLDECDFGSSKSKKIATRSLDNRLQKILQMADSMRAFTKIVNYSATPEEAVFARSNSDVLIFEPQDSYCGPEYYLSNDRIEEAQKFFVVNNDNKNEFQISDQGKECLRNLSSGSKRFGVLRIAYNEKGIKGTFFSYLKERAKELSAKIKELNLNITPLFIDETNSSKFDWYYAMEDEMGNKQKGFWHNLEGNYLIIIHSVASRGTEVGFHPLISFFHDYRHDRTQYATLVQSVGRMFFYKTFYSSFNPDFDPSSFNNEEVDIKIYCDKQTISVMKEAFSSETGDEFINKWKTLECNRPIGNPKRVKIDSVKTGSITDGIVLVFDKSIYEQIDQFGRKALRKLVARDGDQFRFDFARRTCSKDKGRYLKEVVLNCKPTRDFSQNGVFWRRVYDIDTQNIDVNHPAYSAIAKLAARSFNGIIIDSFDSLKDIYTNCYDENLIQNHPVYQVQQVRGVDMLNKLVMFIPIYSPANQNNIQIVNSIHNKVA